jgi:hypothetical protein
MSVSWALGGIGQRHTRCRPLCLHALCEAETFTMGC